MSQNNYRYLEPRPHRWKKQLWIKGRNMNVWNLVATIRTECYTPEEAAENYELPLEAVREALDYYVQNKELVDAEAREEAIDRKGVRFSLVK
ncbi:TPA: DUF433 domain-containing protein [Candidatus Poribacteria bacterium]|nr:DUF433 domain-containing protein [Candidatus Poribacteria bacterium]